MFIVCVCLCVCVRKEEANNIWTACINYVAFVYSTHTQTHIWKHGNIWHVGNNVCQLEGYKIGLEWKIIKNGKIFSKRPFLKNISRRSRKAVLKTCDWKSGIAELMDSDMYFKRNPGL